MAFAIVKHADDNYYHHYFFEDPKVTGVYRVDSCHDTYTGIQENIKEIYGTQEEAQIDTNRLNESNPSGGYAVCKLLDA